MVYDRVHDFLKTRKGDEQRIYTELIIKYLLEHRDQNGGWVRARDLHSALVETGEIPHSTTLNRLLKAMTDADLIEQKRCEKNLQEPGKRPLFYRIKIGVIPQTRDVLFADSKKLYKLVMKLTTRDLAAQLILSELGIKDPLKTLKERAAELERNSEEYMKQIMNKAIPDTDPCQPS
ncbi:MAG: hypothetical protein QMC82_03385 [Methanolinea sp.]|nr:hypothetical protein [Methanolinea sp.]